MYSRNARISTYSLVFFNVVVITSRIVVTSIIGVYYKGGRPLRFLRGAMFSVARLGIPSCRSPPYLFLEKSTLCNLITFLMSRA